MGNVKFIEDGGTFLRDTGLFFEINRQILHPLGLEMIVKPGEHGNWVIANSLVDCREDPEGIIYELNTYNEGNAKFEKFMEEYGLDALEQRQKLLGYVIQQVDQEVEADVETER